MTFLELVQELQSKAGVTGPQVSSVLNQSGMFLKLVNWTKQAWTAIQRKREDWLFMQGTHTGTLVVGTQEYDFTALAPGLAWTDVRKFDPKSWRIEEAGTDRSYMEYQTWDWFRQAYGPADSAAQGRPSVVTEPKRHYIRLNIAPDKAYVVTVDYTKTATELSANAEEPDFPDKFHMAIVWVALSMYGYHEGAPEAIEQGDREWAVMYRDMVRTQTRPLLWQPDPLA